MEQMPELYRILDRISFPRLSFSSAFPKRDLIRIVPDVRKECDGHAA